MPRNATTVHVDADSILPTEGSSPGEYDAAYLGRMLDQVADFNAALKELKKLADEHRASVVEYAEAHPGHHVKVTVGSESKSTTMTVGTGTIADTGNGFSFARIRRS
jgi:hypothetical protein